MDYKTEFMLSDNNNEQLKRNRILFVFWLVEITVISQIVHRTLIQTTIEPTIVVAVFGLLFLSVYYFCKTNRLAAAANSVLILTAILIFSLSWIGGGIKDEVMLVFPALAAFSILLGSVRLFNVIFVLLIIYVLVLGVLNEYGTVFHDPGESGLYSAVLTAIIFTVIGLVMRQMGNDLKTAFTELNDYKDKLEERVEARTQELLASKVKLAESERMASLGRLVAGVAHEINTPLGIALTASSSVVEKNKFIKQQIEAGKLTKTDMTSYLDTVEASSSMVQANLYRASSLISDFKQVAVINTDERKSEFSLRQQLEDTMHAMHPMIEQADATIELVMGEDVRVYQDVIAFTQVITNLIANSCKHGFEEANDGKITLFVDTSDNDDNGLVEIVYQDNGTGINEEVAKHIFEPFYTTKRNNGGTGLGMHIVFNIVTQSLKGLIQLIQEPNEQGAKFSIRFPANS